MSQHDDDLRRTRIGRGGIVRRVDLEGLRRADRILEDAEARRAEAEREAEAAREAVLAEARARALRDSTQAAARIIADAETQAQRKIQELEPQLARLVAQTVRAIIGTLDPDEVRHRAALTALGSLREHRAGRIYCHSRTAETMRRAVADLEPGGAEIEGIVIDDTMSPGAAVLTSDRGHADIGLDALTDAALRAWEEDDTR